MMDILRDSVWQFIGAVVTLIAIVQAFWIYRLQQQTREIAFGLVSARRPLAIADELSSRVTVLVDGKPTRNLHLLVFGLKNSGKRAISPADFERQLSISFAEGQIISAEIASQLPSNIGGKLSIYESRVELAPLLLNASDQILIQVLLTAENPEWTEDVRILDVPTLVPINSRPKLPPFFQSGLPTGMAAMVLLGMSWLLFADKAGMFMGYWFFGLATFMAVFGSITRAINNSGKAAMRRIDGE
jgi:hypothetical protein